MIHITIKEQNQKDTTNKYFNLKIGNSNNDKVKSAREDKNKIDNIITQR